MTQASALISDAKGYAAQMADAARGYLDDAISAVEWANWGNNIGAPNVSMPDPPEFSSNLALPEFGDVPLELPTSPGTAPTYQNISTITPGAAPTRPGAAPTLNKPNKPSQLRQFTNSAPSIDVRGAFPTAPSVLPLTAPALAARSEPTKAVVQLPTMGSIRPNMTGDTPTDLEGTLASAYRTAAPQFITMINGYVDDQLRKVNPEFHPQMARLEAQLAKYLQGGTGLKPEIEDAIYARGRAKNDVEAQRVQNSALADMAARGFTMPNGVGNSMMARARQEAANNNAKTVNEIAIAQAEMEQKNLQFAVTTSSSLRVAMVNASLSYMQNLGQLNGQALDYAKGLLGAVVEMYNIRVKVFAAELEGYKADAAVYEAKMRAAMMSVEIYKAEIAALQALTQVDLAQVSIYQAQISAQTAAVNMYKAQVDAAVSQASMERLKIDLFQAQVQAFSAEVAAKNAEWQAYGAEMSGEEAKARLYTAEVQGYSAQVQGYTADIQGKAEVVRATAATNEALSRQYAASVGAYETQVNAVAKVATTKLENQRVQVAAYTAGTQAEIAKAQIGAEQYKAAAQIAIENGKFAVQTVIAQAEAKRNGTQLIATLQTANATVHANLAGAAMAGMNSLAVEYAEE